MEDFTHRKSNVRGMRPGVSDIKLWSRFMSFPLLCGGPRGRERARGMVKQLELWPGRDQPSGRPARSAHRGQRRGPSARLRLKRRAASAPAPGLHHVPFRLGTPP